MDSIVIKYGNFTNAGTMTIAIDRFLEIRSMAKFRKLLKIIRTSNTPEVENDIKSYIVEYLADVDKRIVFHANKSVDARTEYHEQEAVLNALIKRRSLHRKNTKIYKNISEKVKEQREKMKHSKNVWKSQEKLFDSAIKNKDFYEKCLELIDK